MSSEKQNPTNEQHDLFYEERFWEQYVGKNLVSDPVIAIVELVANCWDAGAKRIDILWPEEAGHSLSIKDNGEGMTRSEFYRRWGGMSYDRRKYQGDTVEIKLGDNTQARKVYGRNGIGRFAGFCFASQYSVSTSKEGERNIFLVKKGTTRPLEFEHIRSTPDDSNGTTIEIAQIQATTIRAETVRTELGKRFLTDPAFHVFVNGVRIAFEDIEEKCLEEMTVLLPELETSVTIKVIDSQRTDPTGRQHGVAWHVLGRLVGECGWKDPEQKSLIDGRRIEAKRFTFIVEANLLQELGTVKPDWSGFDEENSIFQSVNNAVQTAITRRLLEATKEKRDEITADVRRSHAQQVRQMSPIRRERWNSFVEKIAEECPSLSETELKSVSGVLANMEVANSQYGLLHKLHELSPNQIDDLHKILDDWTVDMAKIVLDEIQGRVRLIEELRLKTADDYALEVQELQPLFRQGLWIFGPEFETIHYTSNQGMTCVVQELFGRKDLRGSRNRPDFAILPNGSAGFYSHPEYDDEGNELGPEQLVIVELKAPSVPITEEEKAQCYKYVRELAEKGLLTERTKVRGFVLGKTINPVDRGEKKEMDDRVRIRPLAYDWVLNRAESRLFKLRNKITEAPFLKDQGIDQFLEDKMNDELFLEATAKNSGYKKIYKR